jgi:iron complex outermembrane receptor protein
MSCSVKQSVRLILKSRVLASLASSVLVGQVLAADPGAATTPAPAADQGTGTGLQEVIVTAQFQSQNVQSTPLAITAVSGAALADRGQTSLTSLSQDAPSVQLQQTSAAFGPSMSAFIRGIGQSDLDPALEPGVGIYIDDVYFGTLTGSLFDLLDLDRVEVLRGPQGTLEGMNAEGGAVKLYSKKPDATESMNFDLLGGSRNHIELRAGTNFAITDNLFMRLAAVGNQQDGYVNRYDFGCENKNFEATGINAAGTEIPGTYSVPVGFEPTTTHCLLGQEGGTGYVAGRVAIRWIANEKLEFNLIGDLTNLNQEHPAETLGYAGPGPLVGNASAPTASSFGLGVPTTTPGINLPYNQALVPQIQTGHFYSSYANFCNPAPGTSGTPTGTYGPFGTNAGQQAYCVDPRQTSENWGAQLATDWNIADNMALKSITAFRGYEASWVHDNSVSIWPLDLGAEGMGHHQFSQELRFSGKWDNLVDYTAGVYYFREDTVYFGHEDLSYALVGTVGAVFGPAAGQDLSNGLFNFYQNDPVVAHDKAGFLHTTFHLTSKLDAIIGTRYTDQDKTYHYVRVNPDGTTGFASATLVTGLNGTSSQYADHRWDWRANLNYHVTDDVMAYAQYSTGFKGGGITPRPFYPVQAQPFNPETLSTYEAGIKSSWFDNHLHANIDAYFSQYRDIQLTLSNCSNLPVVEAASALAGANLGTPCALETNAGAGHQKGVEFETQARFGGLQIDANFDWLRFDYTYVNPITLITPADRLPYMPSISAAAGIQYTVPLAASGALTARVDGATHTTIFTSAQNSPYNRTPGYTLFNAHLTWEGPKANWWISLEGKNLSGKRYYFGQFDLVAAGQGTQVDNPGPPLEVDVEIKHTM